MLGGLGPTVCLPTGVGAVCVDRWAAAPPRACSPTAGCAAHHCGHRLLHRVRQQHGHHHHLPACPGRAGEDPRGPTPNSESPAVVLPWGSGCHASFQDTQEHLNHRASSQTTGDSFLKEYLRSGDGSFMGELTHEDILCFLGRERIWVPWKFLSHRRRRRHSTVASCFSLKFFCKESCSANGGVSEHSPFSTH